MTSPTHLNREISVGGPYGIRIGAAPLTTTAGRVQASKMAAVILFVREHRVAVAALMSFITLLILAAPVSLVMIYNLPRYYLFLPVLLGALLSVITLIVTIGTRKSTGELTADSEIALLDAAHTHGHRLTVAQAARALHMKLADAETALSSLARSGYCTVDYDAATGAVTYNFPEA